MSSSVGLEPLSLNFGPYHLQRGGRTLAKDVLFQVAAGHYIELTGANGSGKTTLLRLIAGLNEGSHSGSVAQYTTFYFAHQTGFRPELKVTDQFVLSLQMLGIAVRQADIAAALEAAGLRKQANLQVRELSHGQHRRLLLLVMAKSRRTLWLIDEPLNALDEQAKALFASLLVVHLQQGGAAIVATHMQLQQALPELIPYLGGNLLIAGTSSDFQIAQQVTIKEKQSALTEPAVGISAVSSFTWSLHRELKLIAAKPVDIIWPSIFHLMVVSMFPLAIGAQPELLLRIAPGIFWVSAMLAVLMGANRLFEMDDEHGVLAQMRTAGFSLSALSAGKFTASFLGIGIPVALVSYPMGLLYHLPLLTIHHLSLSLAFGLVSLIAFSGLFAALGLMARQAQVMMSLLAFPVFVPLLIFGTASVTRTEQGFSLSSPIFVLISLAVLTMLTIPLVTAKVLELVIE
ncbi:MAG TPA: heme exporter protein CcmB [Methylophilaceae bacterium]|nr:heme exporter protein CcmB [Methylophilaceae bacterium]